jgi:hypothetical protein
MSRARPEPTGPAQWLWNSIERSAGGHERRRRLESRMTEEQARVWEETYGGKLERVDATPSSNAAVSGASSHQRRQ